MFISIDRVLFFVDSILALMNDDEAKSCYSWIYLWIIAPFTYLQISAISLDYIDSEPCIFNVGDFQAFK